VGVGEHPQGANEAVYDVIKYGNKNTKIEVEWEVLSTAVQCLSTLRPSLPALAFRITDGRLLDALLEVSLWPLPSNNIGDVGDIDIDKLLKALSLCSDIEGQSDELKTPIYLQLLTDLELPNWLAKRLMPFFRLFSHQLIASPMVGRKDESDHVFVGINRCM
jgi:hypothetical protein